MKSLKTGTGKLCLRTPGNILLFIAGLTIFFLANVLDCKAQNKPGSNNSVSEKRDVNNEWLAQISPEGLQVGDKIPDQLWHLPLQVINHPEGKKTTTLDDYKGKLIILDFWATTCSSCIKALPKLDLLQQKFREDVMFIPVTYEDQGRIDLFKQRNAILKNFQLPFVIEDTVLKQLFIHRMIPHVIWIGRDGVIKAVTDDQYINAENIAQLLSGEEVHWPVKKDVLSYDYGNSLLSHAEKAGGYAIVTGYKSGVQPASGFEVDSNARTVRRYMVNYPILKLYLAAWGNYFLPKTHIRLKVADKSRYLYNEEEAYRTVWNQKNSFCYELVLPWDETVGLKEQTRRIKNHMRNDLNRFLNLNGRMEKRRVPCLVLVRTTDEDNMKTGGGKFKNTLNTDDPVKKLHNEKLSFLIWQLNQTVGNLPALDETGYAGKVDLELKISSFRDIAALRRALQPYGLDLKKAEREVELFILTEPDISSL
ncbi:thiol-disulfide isomerase/thioredoxin [Anseongella ginsenosidimutans]|uniref:Thiol-disulfide isomerase/thioredoxin n=1 Tax=Anseongella ginsenosidimutans TaxID=496056 RepID=A0A4R3KVS9_9SPHI|nr:TlpA disulfide reductase family protein [Anseongella ginsenosidimutans]QEC51504.1 TlpA family protein disulfide reductase [Anseongella ginsenosidimutans]TCS88816.1 thiol-disulfide isomerase/thioredoxin [Anseongella ginsenosidimutans]